MKAIRYVGNRNYSSWSLRPWLVLTWAGIAAFRSWEAEGNAETWTMPEWDSF